MNKISAIVLAKDSEATIKSTLESLKDLDEVIVLDTGSEDSTKKVALTYPNVRLFEDSFKGFGTMRHLATSYASHDWILSIDSDEVLSKKALKEILELQLNEKKIYSFPFHNYFNGKFIRWCGWYPDRQALLFNKNKTGFSSDFVHEKILLSEGMEEQKLNGPIEHYPYRKISDFLDKMQRYSTLFAEQNRYKKSSSPLKAVLHGAYAFFKSYILKRGVLGGSEGFIIALYNAQTSYYKYIKLWEANNDASC